MADKINDLFSSDCWNWLVDSARNDSNYNNKKRPAKIGSEIVTEWIILQNQKQDKLLKVIEPNRPLEIPKQVDKNQAVTKDLSWSWLIRDLLNAERISPRHYYSVHGTDFFNTTICGRITDIEDDPLFQKLVIDDGTSAIQCYVKRATQDCSLESNPTANNLKMANRIHLTKALDMVIKKLKCPVEEFDKDSLGTPVWVEGTLDLFNETIVFCASRIKKVSDKYYFGYMNFLLRIYQLRAEHQCDSQ